MKKVKFLLLVSLFLFVTVLSLVACESSESPLPDKYTGTYGSGQYGNLIVTNTTVSTELLLLPQCVVGDVTISAELVCWDPVSFTYFSDKSFEFQAYVESLSSSVKGTANFSGSFADNLETYDIHLTYYGNSQIWFAKSK